MLVAKFAWIGRARPAQAGTHLRVSLSGFAPQRPFCDDGLVPCSRAFQDENEYSSTPEAGPLATASWNSIRPKSLSSGKHYSMQSPAQGGFLLYQDSALEVVLPDSSSDRPHTKPFVKAPAHRAVPPLSLPPSSIFLIGKPGGERTFKRRDGGSAPAAVVFCAIYADLEPRAQSSFWRVAL